ncbi:MAG: hypothetical protein M0Z82_16100 [Actinomycetota bacterium]|nr:hypothetical protein [Actinomycetota bacterium]
MTARWPGSPAGWGPAPGGTACGAGRNSPAGGATSLALAAAVAPGIGIGGTR